MTSKKPLLPSLLPSRKLPVKPLTVTTSLPFNRRAINAGPAEAGSVVAKAVGHSILVDAAEVDTEAEDAGAGIDLPPTDRQ